MRFHIVGKAKSPVYDYLVPYDENKHGKQSKSLDMQQLLLLDYIAVCCMAQR